MNVYKKQCIEYEKILTGREPKITERKISLCQLVKREL